MEPDLSKHDLKQAPEGGYRNLNSTFSERTEYTSNMDGFSVALSLLLLLSILSQSILNNLLRLHGAIYLPDSFVMVLRYCANLEAIRYKSTSFNRIVADKPHRVTIKREINPT